MNELMEHARREMAAANAAKALLNGENTPADDDRAIIVYPNSGDNYNSKV